MESFFVRYRNLVVLLVLLAAQIVGLAVQVRRVDGVRNSLDPKDSGGVRLIRLWAYALVTPPERLIHATKNGVVDLWQNYFYLHNVRKENAQLKQTLDRMRLEQAALLEDARQGERLQALLGFQERYIYKTVAAQIIGSSGSDHSHVFTIDKGSNAGLKPDMAVITPMGIVGKVRDVFPGSAQVLAINDQSSGAGVILETTRIRGILRGNAQGQPQIVGILADQRIKPGEHVLTAGGDQIFPRGLPVGVVRDVVKDPNQDGFIDVIITPSAHLNRLDEVLVITSTEPRFPPDQQQDLAASEALKGAEANSDADQALRKASEIMAADLPGLLEPNVPADQQPLNDTSNPPPVGHVPLPIRPDRFSPPATPATAQPDSTQPPAAAPHPQGNH
ncbi:MAG TPA: rod shape-determining protein MreC [Terracidiphilus sp.]|jgi:rod shape-determining protein MreC|nr:rod shape-determining protein MreC [Terracidiphilus sp.]